MMRKDGKRTERAERECACSGTAVSDAASDTASDAAAERLFQESVKGQYDCTKFCRCCPFPGLKCVPDGRTIH